MAVGTFFTLFVIPSIYMLIAREKNEAVLEPRGELLYDNPHVSGRSA